VVDSTAEKRPLNPARLEQPGVDKSGQRVREMFAQIAPRYDLMNHLLSLGIDIRWRRRAVRELRLHEPAPLSNLPILDCCTGTGDLAIMLAEAVQGSVEVIGTDFCAPMLRIAETKRDARQADWPLQFLEADSQSLPFPDANFQVVTVAFGLRNIQDTDQGLRELTRVCAPGGKIAVLEFSTPTLPGIRQAYQLYFKHVLPRIGQRLARNDSGAYEYLPNSVLEFPSGAALVERMERAGMIDVRVWPLTFGVASLYIGLRG
jgi:demethylmenaquinone methyltransferase/2-methoxy-6-polyprenyl-1,4-benzoquinol methylase